MTRIYDKAFIGQPCMNTVGQEPRHFSWRREGEPGRVAWFTDSCLEQALTVEAAVKVAWILESRSLRTDPYGFVDDHPGLFAYTISLDRDWRPNGTTHIFCPAPGARLYPGDRQIYPKSRQVSIIASPKRGSEGYDLRHRVIQSLGPGEVDAYGQGYTRMPADYKLEALAPYRFTVVIPSSWGGATEAVIDAFLTATAPIYWGHDLEATLGIDRRGVIHCATFEEIEAAATVSTEQDYVMRAPYIERNYRHAQDLACGEDWLFDRYPHLFDEG